MGGSGSPPAVGMTAADAWRVIRGNMWLILTMLCVSLIVGYVANRLLQKYFPRYTASGLVTIHPPTTWNYQTRTQETLGDFAGLAVEQRTQAMLLRSDSLITKVLQNPSSPVRNTKWFHTFEVPVQQPDGSVRPVADLAAAKKALSDSFVAAPIDGTNAVNVSMTASEGRDARDIVLAIVNQHLDQQEQLITDKQFDKQQVLSQVRDTENAHIKDLLDKLHQKTLELSIEGTGRSDKLGTREVELAKLKNERFDLSNKLLSAKTQLDALMAQDRQGAGAGNHRQPGESGSAGSLLPRAGGCMRY